MSDVEKIFGQDALLEISRSVGDVNEKEVADVLEALLPFLDESSKSSDLSQRALDVQHSADVQRGINPMMLLPLLLGGNSSGVLGQVSQSTGVSNNNINSIIKVAAPLLLLYLLKGNNSQSQQQSNPMGLLGSLLGASQPQQQYAQQPQQSGSLLGSLLGMEQSQPQQSASLLGSLLGMEQPKPQQQYVQQPQQSASLLGSLLGMEQPQPQQQYVQQPQQSGGLFGSLLGGGSSNDLLGAFVNLLADNGRAMPVQQSRQKSPASQKNAAKIAEKRAASVGVKNSSGSKKVSTNSSAAKKAAAGSTAAAKREAAKKKK